MPTRSLALAVLVLSSLPACRAHEVIVGVTWDGGQPDEPAGEPPPPLVFAPNTLTVMAGSLLGRGSADGTAAAARFFSPAGVSVDRDGNVFIADTSNHTIRKLTPDGIVTTVAGVAGSAGSDDGSPGRFNTPFGVAVDGAGNVFVADTENSTIRKITPAGTVSTLAGSAGVQGGTDGTKDAASFNKPLGLAVDGAGNIIVTDSGSNTIRKVTQAGVVTTVAGTANNEGNANGTGSAARFHYPTSVAVDPDGNLIVGDTDNNAIRKITPAGVVTTLISSAADFHGPAGLAVDAAGNIYVADFGHDTIRKLTPGGAISTLAGTADAEGATDGFRNEARFHSPSGVAVDAAGNLYVADFGNDTIRKVTPGGTVSTLAGAGGTSATVDGTGAAARFAEPWGVALDRAGNVFVADANHTIRSITPAGVVGTLAGAAGVPGAADGIGTAARFNKPVAVAVDSKGNVFVADSVNNTIRSITPAGAVGTVAGTAGTLGAADGTGAAARFYHPTGIAVDSEDNIFVADQNNYTIRKITMPAGDVVTWAGSAGVFGAANGIGTAATFNLPSGVAVDGAGNVFVADTGNSAIRAIDPNRTTTTLGTADAAGSADGGSNDPTFNRPIALAVGADGNLFVADRDNNAIRKLSPAGGRSTIVGGAAVTTAGSVPGALPGSLDHPRGVAVDPATGRLYITVDWAVLVATP